MSEDSSSPAPDLWGSLETIVRMRTYQAGAALFEQGQPARGIYMIYRGQVRVWMEEDTSNAIHIDPAGAGTMLGLSETIAQGTHKVSATASVPTEVGFVASEPLMQYLRDHHDICLQVVRVLSEDLHVLYHTFQGLKTSQRGRRLPGHPEPI